MSIVVKFFLICSGVSLELIKRCPFYERTKYASIGATIFFTAVLAFISSFFALNLIFDSILLIISGAFFWACIIFNLDRYIVLSLKPSSSLFKNFFISTPRLIIAILVAIVISKPIEIKLFENEINQFLEQNKISNLYEIEKRYMEDLSKINERKDKLILSFEKKEEVSNNFFEDYICECNGTCGTMLRGRGVECEARRYKYETFNAELKIEKIKKDSILKSLSIKEIQIQKLIEDEREILTASVGFGFFDRVKALKIIDNISSKFILLIFIMIETAPILTKLLTNKGPYDILLLKSEIEFDTDLIKTKGILNLQREKNKINRISAEFDLKSKETEFKNINRQVVFQKYEKIRKKIGSS